jgi:ribonuclease HI
VATEAPTGPGGAAPTLAAGRSGRAPGGRGAAAVTAGKGSAGGKRPAFAAGDFTARRPESECVQLWTDGACTGNPGPAGLGVLYLYRGEVKELSEYLGQGTNNIAELTAILRGLELVEDPTTPVDVITDSSYCIGLLSQGWKAKANQELVATLRAKLSRFTDVRLLKVPGHAGVEGNERADQLATGAILTRP